METRRRPAFSVFEQFRAFWKEVEVLRAAAIAPAMAPQETAVVTTALTHVPTATRDRLLVHLKGQQADVSRWASGAVLQYYRQAQYVMVAAADEVFVQLPWSGAAHWRSARAARARRSSSASTRCSSAPIRKTSSSRPST
jgi:hypothetical protein